MDRTDDVYIVTKEFVEKLFCGVSKLSTRYDNDIFSELPYIYTERRLDCVILPVLSKICKGLVLDEYPVQRQCSTNKFYVDNSAGRIDYWCVYGGYSFVIELKHSFDCFTTERTSESKVIKSWYKMNEQLESIKKKVRFFEEKTKGVILLGLHFITSYSDRVPNEILTRQFKKKIPEIMGRLPKDVSKRYPSLKPEIIIGWSIPAKIVLNGELTFPGLWAMAKISDAIQHHGSRVE
ncbi:MAG: hypothetical protein ACI3ZQ_10465 [Candidatus Cryptobacteroides sp.]